MMLRKIAVLALALGTLTLATAAERIPAPAPAPIPFDITSIDDKGGTVVPDFQGIYPYVAGTYDANGFNGKTDIYVEIVDSNLKIIGGGKATKLNNGTWVWQDAGIIPPTNPAFIYAYWGPIGSYQVTNSYKVKIVNN